MSTLLVLLLLLLLPHSAKTVARWDYPVLPSNYDSLVSAYADSSQLIPRHVWFNLGSFQEAPPLNSTAQLPEHLQHIHALKLRETNYTVHLADDTQQHRFIDSVFTNTSTQWAFHQISPKLGVSKSDIWRYTVLLIHGGIYLDEDSCIDGMFRDLVGPNDALILAEEPSKAKDECYKDWHHLSDAGTRRRLNATQSTAMGPKSLANWGMLAAPKHPVIRRTLENVVEMVRLEYLRQSALKLSSHAYRWKIIMCVTGPAALTVSTREALLEQPGMPGVRFEKRDFVDYGGRFKIWAPDATTPAQSHYMLKMQRDHLHLLHSYRPTPLKELELLSIERDGFLLGGQRAPPLFFIVFNKHVRYFDDALAVRTYGFVEKSAVTIDQELFASLPKGPAVPQNFSINDPLGAAILRALDKTLVKTLNPNANHQHKFYVIENGSSHMFLYWDHMEKALKEANTTAESAVQVSEELLTGSSHVSNHAIPVGGFYKLRLLPWSVLVSVVETKGLYVLQNSSDGSYCSFLNWDKFLESRYNLPGAARNALQIPWARLNNTPHAGDC